MSGRDRATIEAVGENYDRQIMLEVRERTRRAIHAIAARISPGMVEEDAVVMARSLLAEAELLRGWHGTYVRFGANTLIPYGASSEPGRVLGENDIFFIDIGPIWRKWEGDGGETFVVGNDPEMAAAQRDVRVLFDAVRDVWRRDRLSGEGLYRFAEREAEAMGWSLNLDLSGHRLSDFPHSAFFKGSLAEAPFAPTAELWVLEMHIRHPIRPFGAFYEDMLIDD